MRALYMLLLTLAIPPALWLLQRRAAPADRPRWRERFGSVAPVSDGIEVWVHAASVGEVQAASPLVDALLARHGDGRIGITTMTATGSALVQQRWGARIHHAFVPFDLPVFVRRFLQRWRPRRAIVMESELWPSLFRALARRGIPLLIANARMSPRSSQRYARFGGAFVRSTMGCASVIAAQSDHDAQSYRRLGARRVEVTGNLKFDCAVPQTQIEAGHELRAALGAQRPVWIAASTHAGEETAALAAHRAVLSQAADAALILVPRHPQRFDAVWREIEDSGLRALRRSAGVAPDARTQVLMGDSMGEMFRYLAAADAAFVGGSLVPIGGHNALEPAALGVPVLFGPQMDNQRPARALLLDADGAAEVVDAAQLGATLIAWFTDPAASRERGARAREAQRAHQGATQRILALFDSLD